MEDELGVLRMQITDAPQAEVGDLQGKLRDVGRTCDELKEAVKVRNEEAETERYRLFYHAQNTGLLVMLFLYPVVSQRLFRMVPSVCRELINGDEDGWMAESWHADDFRVDCTVQKHSAMVALSLLLIFLCPLAVPYYFFHSFVTIMHKKETVTVRKLRGVVSSLRINIDTVRSTHIEEGSALVQQAKIKTTNASTQTAEISDNYAKLLAKFSFMVGDYKPNYYYWEVLIMVQKMVLTAAIGVVRRGKNEQIFMATVISLFYLTLHVKCWPYKDPVSNYIKLAVEVNIVIVYLASLALRNNVDPAISTYYGWFLVFVTIGLTPAFLGYAFFAISKTSDSGISEPDPSMRDSEDGDWITAVNAEGGAGTKAGTAAGTAVLEPDTDRHKVDRSLNTHTESFTASKLQPKFFVCRVKCYLTTGAEQPSTRVLTLRPGQRFRAIKEWTCPATGAQRLLGTVDHSFGGLS
eukprot:SAG22_NODE_3452_length_1704_cov_1.356386_2_plen_464_part_01